MKKMISFVVSYVRTVPVTAAIRCTFFIAILIFCNYRFGLNAALHNGTDFYRWLGWFGLFLIVFGGAYYLQGRAVQRKLFRKPMLLLLVVIAPALFAWKMTAAFGFRFSEDVAANGYWNQVVYWPLKMIVVTAVLAIIWRITKHGHTFYGTALHQFNAQPYLGMLLLMIPLLALAATQPDFLAIYPKLQHNAFLASGKPWYLSALYELAYGVDFVTIELFFRGFLVLAFARWVGKEAVLPMALFYCAIHFGKPLGECISSYFGGLILGAITLHTRSIWGGLLVHLGIAWLMEVFGALGHAWAF